MQKISYIFIQCIKLRMVIVMDYIWVKLLTPIETKKKSVSVAN